jgi:hypothetical protein
MLAALTYPGLGRPDVAEPVELDPGFITLVTRMVQALLRHRQAAAEGDAAAFIEANGGHLTDKLERQVVSFFF